MFWTVCGARLKGIGKSRFGDPRRSEGSGWFPGIAALGVSAEVLPESPSVREGAEHFKEGVLPPQPLLEDSWAELRAGP